MTGIGAHRLGRLLGDWTGRGRGARSVRLAAAIRGLVTTGQLVAGVRLPSERELARHLAVGRNTVAAAFDDLRAAGVLASRHGAGTFVSTGRVHSPARGEARLHSFSEETGFSEEAGTGLIDLRSAALPGLDLVTEELDRLSGADLADLVAGHGYLPGGLPELREAVAGYYDDLGLPTTPRQILITTGAQQALGLVVAALAEPGACAAIENPTFRGAIEAFRHHGVRLVGVPSGPAGIDPDRLADAVRAHRPAVIAIQSTGHNPTGSVLPEPQRAAVAAIAARGGVPILDDAAVADALVDATRPPVPMASFGAEVITLGSASKSFWGGLRVGWIRADAATVTRLASVKGGEDLGTSLVAQVLTVRLLGRIGQARAQRRRQLRLRREVLLRALHDELPAWRPQFPEGGASMWVRLPAGLEATAVAQRARRHGVAVLPGPTFSPSDGLQGWLRIAYAASPEAVREGVRRLHGAVASG